MSCHTCDDTQRVNVYRGREDYTIDCPDCTPSCKTCNDTKLVDLEWEGEKSEVSCPDCTGDKLSRVLREGTIIPLINVQKGDRIQLLDHWHTVYNDELDCSFMVGKIYDYDKSYKNGNLKYWQIELGLENNKYDHDLREWENSLIFTSHDGNDEDKLKVILLK